MWETLYFVTPGGAWVLLVVLPSEVAPGRNGGQCGMLWFKSLSILDRLRTRKTSYHVLSLRPCGNLSLSYSFGYLWHFPGLYKIINLKINLYIYLIKITIQLCCGCLWKVRSMILYTLYSALTRCSSSLLKWICPCNNLIIFWINITFSCFYLLSI